MSLGYCRDVRWETYSYLAEYQLNASQGDNIMKKSLIWTAAGVAAIGLAAPAFAAHRADDVRPVVSTPTVATVGSTVASSVASIAPSGNSVQPVTVNSVSDDAATHDSLDD